MIVWNFQANFANLASRSMGKAYVGSNSNSFNTELDTLLNDVLRIVTDRTFELSRIIEVSLIIIKTLTKFDVY